MADFVYDSYTGTSGEALNVHTGELGATWTQTTASIADGGTSNVSSNQLRPATFHLTEYYASGVPASADYDVSGTVVKFGASDGSAVAVCGRMSTSAQTYYRLQYYGAGGSGALALEKYVNGSYTSLGTYAEPTFTLDETRVIKLEMRGTTLKGYVGGVERISVTDSSITAAGRAGVTLYNGGGNIGLEDFTASDAAAGGATVSTTATISLPAFSGSVSAQPVVATSATATLPTFSGSITSGSFSASFAFTPPTPSFAGSVSVSAGVSAATTVALPTFSGAITIATGGATITITDLKDLTTGTLRASEAGVTAIISNVGTGDLVAKLTGQTSTAGGDMSLSHASLVAATQYRVTIVLADGSEGTWKYTAA